MYRLHPLEAGLAWQRRSGKKCPKLLSLPPSDFFPCLPLSTPKWKSKHRSLVEAVHEGQPQLGKWMVGLEEQAPNVLLTVESR